MTSPASITVPQESVRELAKWAYAASYYDGIVALDRLTNLPGVGDIVAELAAQNLGREKTEFPEDFDDL